MAALTVPFPLDTIPMIPFLAGSVLLLLRPLVAWPLLAMILAGVMVTATPLAMAPALRLSMPAFTASIGLVVYAVSRLSDLTRQLEATNRELVERAAEAERLRIARDVHDLVCSNLYAIALKGEIALKVAATEPAQSTQNLNDLLSLAQRTLRDIRSLAAGPVDVNLSSEAASARALLAAAEIDATGQPGRHRSPHGEPADGHHGDTSARPDGERQMTGIPVDLQIRLAACGA